MRRQGPEKDRGFEEHRGAPASKAGETACAAARIPRVRRRLGPWQPASVNGGTEQQSIEEWEVRQ